MVAAVAGMVGWVVIVSAECNQLSLRVPPARHLSPFLARCIPCASPMHPLKDLMTQDGGCPDYEVCPAKKAHCACTNCKYADHAGTIIIALDV